MKNLILILILIFSFFVSIAAIAETEAKMSETTGSFKWTRALLDMVESADPKQGKKIAKEHKCQKCHGETGIADESDTPNIAGQTATYHFKQMIDYKNKVRDEKTMTKRAKKLTEQEMADMAVWYATQKAAKLPKSKPKKEIITLITKGDKKRLLLPCNVCHGKKGEGLGIEVPAIAGQQKEHFIEMMLAFREDDRENDQYGRMRFIAKQLTEKEIEQLADYYATPIPPE